MDRILFADLPAHCQAGLQQQNIRPSQGEHSWGNGFRLSRIMVGLVGLCRLLKQIRRGRRGMPDPVKFLPTDAACRDQAGHQDCCRRRMAWTIALFSRIASDLLAHLQALGDLAGGSA